MCVLACWLTGVLQDSLGGNTKTAFVVTLSPSEDATDESISTLQFADRAKRVHRETGEQEGEREPERALRPASHHHRHCPQVMVHAMVNEALDDDSIIRRQEAEIAR